MVNSLFLSGRSISTQEFHNKKKSIQEPIYINKWFQLILGYFENFLSKEFKIFHDISTGSIISLKLNTSIR